jgi:hypothetical protein
MAPERSVDGAVFHVQLGSYAAGWFRRSRSFPQRVQCALGGLLAHCSVRQPTRYSRGQMWPRVFAASLTDHDGRMCMSRYSPKSGCAPAYAPVMVGDGNQKDTSCDGALGLNGEEFAPGRAGAARVRIDVRRGYRGWIAVPSAAATSDRGNSPRPGIGRSERATSASRPSDP